MLTPRRQELMLKEAAWTAKFIRRQREEEAEEIQHIGCLGIQHSKVLECFLHGASQYSFSLGRRERRSNAKPIGSSRPRSIRDGARSEAALGGRHRSTACSIIYVLIHCKVVDSPGDAIVIHCRMSRTRL